MSEANIANLSVKETESLEDERMEKNAWNVTHQLVDRLDGAPVLSELIRSLPSLKSNRQFFFNKDRLKKFSAAPETTKMSLPGSYYFKKIFDFFEDHYEVGELYMEYKRDSCVDKNGTKCKFCNDTDWKGMPMDRISRPWPDYTKLPEFHYKHFSETLSTDESGNPRRPDDFQPRANLNVMFEENSISLDDAESIERFTKKFIVAENLTRDYLEHLQNLKRMKEIRTHEKQKERNQIQAKGYHDYNWEELVEERTIGKLLVKELDRYLEHNNLPMTGKQ